MREEKGGGRGYEGGEGRRERIRGGRREEGEDTRGEKGGGRGYERWQVKKERD